MHGWEREVALSYHLCMYSSVFTGIVFIYIINIDCHCIRYCSSYPPHSWCEVYQEWHYCLVHWHYSYSDSVLLKYSVGSHVLWFYSFHSDIAPVASFQTVKSNKRIE